MMAGKKTKSEIEAIRGELTELTEAIYALREQVRVESAARAAASRGDGATPEAPRAVAAMPDGEVPGEGEIALRGSVRLPGGGDGQPDLAVTWSWTGPGRAAGASEDTVRALAAMGHRQRLAILRWLLDGPASAADLVGSLQLGTTGAAYHHLNVLLGAGLVMQAERGIYAVRPDRMPLLLTLLASSLISPSVTDANSSEQDPAPAPASRRSRKAAAA